MAYTSRFSEQFPDLFARLSDEQAFRISQILANGYLEGWEPTREDVSDLIDFDLGRIDSAEYDARAVARSRRIAQQRAESVREQDG